MNDDLISRSALLQKKCRVLGYIDQAGYKSKVWAIPVEVIENAPAADVAPVREWIGMKEKFPEQNGTYLCVWQGKKIDTGFFLDGHFRLYGEIKDHLITHWMPLPEPPKED